MGSQPEFIIVPGAWHSPESFKPTSDILEQKGYAVHGVNLKCYGASPPLRNFDPDVQVIRETVNKVLSSGKDAVIIYHSYGSVPGSEALSEYMKELEGGNRKEGWGKIQRLVFCCAFVLPEGGSLMAALQYKDLPWFIVKVHLFPIIHSVYCSLLTTSAIREMKSFPTPPRKYSTMTSQPKSQHPTSRP